VAVNQTTEPTGSDSSLRWWDLKFYDSDLESHYIAEYFERNISRTRIALAFALVVLLAYVFLDVWVLKSPEIAIRVRIGLAFPVVIGLLVYSFTSIDYSYYRVLGLLCCLVLGSQIWLLHSSGSTMAIFVTMAHIQFTMFVAVLLLIPFVHVFWITTLFGVVMILTLRQFGYSSDSANFQVGIIGVTLISLVFSYSRDKSHRRLFAQEIEVARLTMQSQGQQSKQINWLRNLSRYLEHELKNHVFIVQANLEFLRESTPAEHQPFVAQSQRALAKLGELCESVSEASSLDAALHADVRYAVDLSQLISDRVTERARNFTDRNSVTVDIDENLWVQGSEVRLLQMVDNLLNNALDHSQPNTEIEIVLKPAGCRVVLSVHNQGHPLPVDRDIFAMFESSKPKTHLGIGLYVAKKIAEHHGGTIEAHTRGEETIFVVSLDKTPAPEPPLSGTKPGFKADNVVRFESDSSKATH